MGISGGEIIIIFLVILMLFGADKLPSLAKTIGKGMNEFRKAADEIKREINENTSEIRQELNDTQQIIKEETQNIKQSVEEEMVFNPYENLPEGTDYNENEPQIKTTKKRPLPNPPQTEPDVDNGNLNHSEEQYSGANQETSK
jgi:TatA/E family protein of Tat protein translocase